MKSRNPDADARVNAESDAELFEQAMSDVKRIHHAESSPRQARHSIPVLSTAPPSNSASEFGEELRFVRPGIQTSVLQKLRRGSFAIEATLDLHGLTAAEAASRVTQFIQQSQTAGRSAVRIVHGKGLGSTGRQPVLKTRVQELLPQLSAVLAFRSARIQNGGTGAVDVLIRKLKTLR